MSDGVWLKAHALVGTTTNMIAAANITESSGNDSPELPGPLIRADRHLPLKEVTADKAHLGHANLKAIEDADAIPYVPFKSNSQSTGSAAWRRMWGPRPRRGEGAVRTGGRAPSAQGEGAVRTGGSAPSAQGAGGRPRSTPRKPRFLPPLLEARGQAQV